MSGGYGIVRSVCTCLCKNKAAKSGEGCTGVEELVLNARFAVLLYIVSMGLEGTKPIELYTDILGYA